MPDVKPGRRTRGAQGKMIKLTPAEIRAGLTLEEKVQTHVRHASKELSEWIEESHAQASVPLGPLPPTPPPP